MSKASEKGCRWVLLYFFAAALIFSACTGATATEHPTAAPVGFITPYWSPSPTRIAAASKIVGSTPVPPPVPTPTPFTYKVVKGDTMLGIALRYGLTLEELQAANPDTDPRFLSVGVELVIPLNEGTPQVVSTPTPVPLDTAEPACYATSDRGLWCFYLVKNSTDEDLENLSARIVLSSDEPGASREGIAIPPLNLLPPGKSIPLGIFFSSPIPKNYSVIAKLLSALPVASSSRYLPAKVQVDRVEISPDGSRADVTGEVSLPKKSPAAKILWVAGVAYGKDGAVIGMRKWEAGSKTPDGAPQPESMPTAIETIIPTASSGLAEETAQAGSPLLKGGESLPFNISIYSLGPAIDHVEVLVEARP